MKIYSKVSTTINGLEIHPGIGNYPIDHKEPATADQLRILRDEMKVITFGELLYCDVKGFDPKEGVKPFEKIKERKEAYKAEKEKAKVKADVRGRTEVIEAPREDEDTDLGGGGVSGEEED